MSLLPKMLQETPNMLIALGFMVSAATTIIVVACRRVRAKTIHALKNDIHVKPPEAEALHMNDALKFPITGSCVLFGLYVAIKYIPKEYLTAALMGYLTLVSVGGMAMSVRPALGASIPIGIACCAIGVAYWFTKHWILNNVMAFALCVISIELLHIKSFSVAAILLSLLFFYDIFWVFGTDVMVTVAKSIEGPIKLLFPHDIMGNWEKKSLLGLGDIVLPGIFITQVLRMNLMRSNGTDETYFNVVMVAYVMSLLTTMGVMVFFEAAQPALLYIVPYLIAAVLATAAARGEFSQIIKFDEDDFERERLGRSAPATANNSAATSPNGSASPVREPTFSEELWQAVLSVFGQDDEYLSSLKNNATNKRK